MSLPIYTTNTTSTAPGGPFTIGSTAPRMVLDNSGNLSVGNGGGPFGSSGTITAPGGVITDADKVSMADLNSEVFSTPVETLINLWLTKYGNAWVDIADVMEDSFYGRVYKRLRSLSELEVHYLTDRARFVCRRHE